MRSQTFAVVLLFACAVTVTARDPSAAAVSAPPPVPASAAGSAAAWQEASAVESSLGLGWPARRLIQQGLNNEGFDAGAPDGLFGPRTRAAIRRWQEARGLPATGYLDGGQAELLRAAAVPSVASAEPVAPSAALAGRAGDGVPTAAEPAGSTAQLRAAGGPSSRASGTAPTAEPDPARPVSCDGWNTQEFFDTVPIEAVRTCLAAGADPMALDDDGGSPLHRAARGSADPLVIEARIRLAGQGSAFSGGKWE